MSTTCVGTAVWATSAQIPDDGDDISAASVNVALEAWADRTQWLRSELARVGGAYQVAYVNSFAWDSWVAGATSTSLAYETDSGVDCMNQSVQAGDRVQVHVNFMTNGPDACAFRLAYRMGATGSNIAITAAEQAWGASGTAGASLHGMVDAPSTGNMHVLLQARILSTGTACVYGPIHSSWVVMREI